MLYSLLKHPDILKRVVAEANALFTNGIPMPEALEKMGTLHGTAMETLRMYPLAGVLPRTAMKDFEFADHQISQGSELLIAAMVSHFLPKFYPEPDVFNIDRYHEPHNQHRQPGAFSPFGLGSHTCLGAGLAEIQIMLTMATLLNRLELEITPPDFGPKIANNPTLSPGYDFRVRIRGEHTSNR